MVYQKYLHQRIILQILIIARSNYTYLFKQFTHLKIIYQMTTTYVPLLGTGKEQTKQKRSRPHGAYILVEKDRK